ncbi:hypothetical protein B2G71_10005 [Novosphingobium sp. PC22D]|nr:hypothetical protein B2G71_10005 [Novosphingobium sp. PC22D]
MLCPSANAQIVSRTPPSGDAAPDLFDVGFDDDGNRAQQTLQDTLETIKRSRKQGKISKAEARVLRKDARRIASAAERYSRDGLSQSESRELETRAHALKSMTDAQRFADHAPR